MSKSPQSTETVNGNTVNPNHENSLSQSIKETLFNNDYNKEFKNFNKKFASIYYIVIEKIKEEYGDDESEKARINFIKVLKLILDSPNVTEEKVLIGAASFFIKSKKTFFDGLEQFYGVKIALAVESLKKGDINSFIDDTIVDLNKRDKFAKNRIEIEYRIRFENFENFKKYINNFAISKGYTLTEEDLLKIATNALDIKFADIINDIGSRFDETDPEKIKQKIIYIRSCYLNIFLETNSFSFDVIEKALRDLEIQLLQEKKGISKAQSHVKSRVRNTLPK